MRYSPSIALSALAVVSLYSSADAQKLPPVRLLDRPVAVSKRDFGYFAGVRQLPNGRVLVNDAGKRKLVLLDSALVQAAVIVDSAAGSANAYGGGPGGLLAYAGDSSLLVLPRNPSMYMIDPTGKVVRVMSVPRPQDAYAMSPASSGNIGFDALGRWVYRGQTPPAVRRA
jgi:hypothetical protein